MVELLDFLSIAVQDNCQFPYSAHQANRIHHAFDNMLHRFNLAANFLLQSEAHFQFLSSVRKIFD